MSTERLEYICDGIKSHPNIDRIEACYEIRDCIQQRQSEWKGELKATGNLGKGLDEVFNTVVKEILQ